MKTIASLFAALLLAGAVSACAQTGPRDTGSMAYPAPLPQGNISTTTTTGASRTPSDVGSMAIVQPRASGVYGNTTPGSARTPTDTGSMAYPAPLPQGTVK